MRQSIQVQYTEAELEQIRKARKDPLYFIIGLILITGLFGALVQTILWVLRFYEVLPLGGAS